MARSINTKIPEHWFYEERNPLYLGKINRQSVSFILVPVGAPGIIMFMEEMIACGAKIFIGIGFAGSLQPKVTIGTFLIPNNCISEEGTSSHYIDTKTSIKSSSKISKIIEESCKEERKKTFTAAAEMARIMMRAM